MPPSTEMQETSSFWCSEDLREETAFACFIYVMEKIRNSLEIIGKPVL